MKYNFWLKNIPTIWLDFPGIQLMIFFDASMIIDLCWDKL